MAILSIPVLTLLWAAGPTPTLEQAIQAYDQLDDARAADAFHRILAGRPPSEVAARAHLYLGLLAFNAFHPDQAREEFKKAIESNPALDFPHGYSPKAAIFFEEARRDVAQELANQRVQLAPQVLERPTEEAPSHPHVLALSLGGVAVALGVVAVVGGFQVLNYNSLVSSDNNTFKGSSTTSSAAPVTSSQGSADFWRVGWIVFAAGGAAALTAGILTW